MDHQDDFENLLKNLKGATDSDNNSSNTEEPTKSILNLEQAKTKTSQLRHPKLIKAKNLSKATNNDLDCILGTKKRKMKKLAEEDESSVPAASSKMDDESESECERRVSFKQNNDVSSTNKPLADSMSSIFTTNSQSIGDYFKNKMKARLNPTNAQPPVEEPAVVQEEMEEEEEVEKKKKSKKSKKSKREESEQVEEEPEPVIEEESAEPEIKKKKKHKKSKETVENEEPVGVQEEAKNGEGDVEQEYFPGSNLFDINGYTPYVITATTNGLINERLKKAKVKQAAYQKNIEKDKNFYAMSKKSKHLE